VQPRGDPGRRYHLADLKKLFILSYNQCAFSHCDLPLADMRWPQVRAEIAHIHGLRPTAPRYLKGLSNEEVNAYENLILLCRNHHQEVDFLVPEDYPAERLFEMKRSHEERQRTVGGHHRSRPWCSATDLDGYVDRLVRTLGIIVIAAPRKVRSKPSPAEGTREPRTTKQMIRVHELAKELGLTSKEGLDLCIALGIGVKSSSAGIQEAQADRARRRAEKEGLGRFALAEKSHPVRDQFANGR